MRNSLNRRPRFYAGCLMLVMAQAFGYAGQSPVTAPAVLTGVIEGRVIDETGNPVVWARVQPV